ncbi:L-lactate dehydrogenase [Thermanaeromonas toyohensis ToBE]|uniref:L-lactate dehydrogenase n=1 Tax=Thermanaeromonas toyohensis ToBE TaxID=698762 RepID=A0A1W1W0H5_9FIRM|nr:L-lactate dehydrogenase [Thermanaeromonas toyohensis]SMB99098.1 L-lactate dehydrogenase [Thermanaeromonas toyohensis ToBE]
MPKQGTAKVAIIGAGYVGSTTAFSLLFSGVVGEIVLVDINRAKAQGEAMDLSHAATLIRPLKILSGEPRDCAGADILIFTAGANQRPGESRLDLVHRNARLVQEALPEFIHYCPDALILMVTNPVDILTYVAWKVSHLPPSRVLGSGTVLDSARFRHLLSLQVGVDPRNIHAYVIGEHGDTEVPVFSLANIAGIWLDEFPLTKGTVDRDLFKADISHQVREAAYEIIQRKGFTSYGVALALTRITEAILRDERRVLTISSVIHDLYDINYEVALSLPCVIGREGRISVLPLPLAPGEKLALHRSAETLREVIETLKI